MANVQITFTSRFGGLVGNITSVRVTGIDEAAAKLQRLNEKAPIALARGLYECAQAIMTDAKQRTPVDTGNLRASGHVQPNSLNQAINGTFVEFQAGFGGPAGAGNIGETNRPGKTDIHGRPHDGNVGYAVYVHELGPRPGGVGEKRFLANAVEAKRDEFVQIIGKHADRMIAAEARGAAG